MTRMMIYTQISKPFAKPAPVALLAGAVFIMGLMGSAPARAQVTLDSPDVEACATQIQRGLRQLSVGPYNRTLLRRTVLRTLFTASACHLPEDVRTALQLNYRTRGLPYSEGPPSERVNRLLDREREAVLAVTSHPRRPECAVPERPTSDIFAVVGCLPDAIPIRELNTGARPRFLTGLERLLLVQVVDALAAASPRLMATAQMTWMYACWLDCECIPSVTFLWMRGDLRAQRVRFIAYPDERRYLYDREIPPEEDRMDADYPWRAYGPFLPTPHPIELAGP